MSYYNLRGCVSVDTTAVAGSPAPALVKALTLNVNSALSFTRTEKYFTRPVSTEDSREEFFGP